MVSPQNIKIEREINAKGDILGRLNVAKVPYCCSDLGWSHARSNFKLVSICKKWDPEIEQIRKKGPVDDQGKTEPAEPRPRRGEGGS